jgi:hypothetical protein
MKLNGHVFWHLRGARVFSVLCFRVSCLALDLHVPCVKYRFLIAYH